MNLYQQYSTIFDGITTPAAWVDMDKFDNNIQTNLDRANHRSIRIASKSVRCVHLLRYLLNASQQFNGIMCYHPQEAALLVGEGFDDLLIAYPSLCRDSLMAALQASTKPAKLYFMVDRVEHVALLDGLAAELNIKANLCLDLDMSVPFPGVHFGVHRSNIKTPRQAVEFYRRIKGFQHINLCGLMGYEAQIAGLGDQVPGKALQNIVVRYLKKKSLPIINDRRTETILALLHEGAQLTLINGGGTGSIESTIQEPLVNEVTVGSGFYCSHLFDYYRNFKLEPAAGFVTSVARKPSDDIVTCNGGGYVASGNAERIKMPQPYLPAGLKLDPNEGTGEVQTPLHTQQCKQALEPGDPVFFRHAKAGELCEHFNHLYLIRNGTIEDKVTTYRGNGWVFM
ncbi:MAG: alanine racemase [Pseudomonadota bacterium]|nr:alanine racemase [Pseudomonadota bacterium]